MRGHAFGVELGELVEFFAFADVFDGFAGDGAHREGGAAAGVAVEFGEDDPGEIDGGVEGFGDLDGLLAGGGVGHEEVLAGLQEAAESPQFFEEAVIDFLAPGGVEDEEGTGLALGPLQGGLGGFQDVFFVGVGGEARDTGLLGDLGELVDGGGPVEVGGDEERAAAVFFQAQGELAGGGGLAGAVEPAEDDAGRGVEVEGGAVAAEESGEFVVEDFDDLFAGFDGFEDLLAEGLLLDVFDEGLCDLVFDVGFEEGEADFPEGRGDVFFRDFADPAEVAEGLVEVFGERGEHGMKGYG